MSFIKSKILMGNTLVEEVEIEGLNVPVPIHPLTDGQYAQIQQIRSQGMTVRGKATGEDPQLEFDLEVSNRNQYNADVKAVYYGLATEEKWSEDEIRSLRPPGVVSKIAQEVYRISGVERQSNIESEIESFR